MGLKNLNKAKAGREGLIQQHLLAKNPIILAIFSDVLRHIDSISNRTARKDKLIPITINTKLTAQCV